jgi:antitoxin VapB
MARASIFKNGSNQAIRLPREMELTGVSEVEMQRQGDTIIITPVRKNWSSFVEVEAADEDFLAEREPLVEPERVKL